MRKLTALIMAIAFILLPLSAADLSETGVGSTREEAIAAADAALAQRIAMTTTSEMRTIRADDGSDSVDFMVVNGRSFYSTEFLGSSFETEQLADGTWIATRTIPESSYRLYQKRLRESASIINDIYDGIELFGIDRESYTRIYSQLREYERNAVIVSMLRSNASIPEIPTNSVDIEAMYQSYLAESINATEQDVRRLEVQRELGIIGEAHVDRSLSLQGVEGIFQHFKGFFWRETVPVERGCELFFQPLDDQSGNPAGQRIGPFRKFSPHFEQMKKRAQLLHILQPSVRVNIRDKRCNFIRLMIVIGESDSFSGAVLQSDADPFHIAFERNGKGPTAEIENTSRMLDKTDVSPVSIRIVHGLRTSQENHQEFSRS